MADYVMATLKGFYHLRILLGLVEKLQIFRVLVKQLDLDLTQCV
jgi:hypothetical protein